MKVSKKNIIFSNTAGLRTPGYCKVAELLLVHLLKMNSFRSLEDQLDFLRII